MPTHQHDSASVKGQCPRAGRDGYVISGRVEPQQLVESPYLIHPVEEKTVRTQTVQGPCLLV